MSLVLVIGISGFFGSHLVNELLKAGYRVRGTARAHKLAFVKARYATSPYKDQIEVVEVNDIIHGDITEALKGVDVLIHSASPLFKGTAEEEIAIAEQGTLNVITQAEKAGIPKMIVTSSASTALNIRGRWTAETWCPYTKEQAFGGHLDWFSYYIVSKAAQEQAVWKFADKHPHVDMTTINGNFFYGKFAPGFEVAKGDMESLSTNEWIYQLLKPDGKCPMYGGCTDIVDVARAHVLAITAPPTSEVGRKRILMSSEWFDFKDVVEYIAKMRPELKHRLVDGSNIPESSMVGDIVDSSRCKEVLGMDQRDWRDTIIDAVDALVELEKKWEKEQ